MGSRFSKESLQGPPGIYSSAGPIRPSGPTGVNNEKGDAGSSSGIDEFCTCLAAFI